MITPQISLFLGGWINMGPNRLHLHDYLVMGVCVTRPWRGKFFPTYRN